MRPLSCTFRVYLGIVLLDQLLESAGVGTDELVGSLAVLVDEEGRHGADVELGSDVGDLLDVELEEVDVLELFRVGVPVENTC